MLLFAVMICCMTKVNAQLKVFQEGYTRIGPDSIAMMMDDNLPGMMDKYAGEAYFGKNIDTNRPAGNVTVLQGVTYELEFRDSVNLMPGFEVAKGAVFSIILSDY